MKGLRPSNPYMREISQYERGKDGSRRGIGLFTIGELAMKYSWAIPDYRVARVLKRLLPHNRIFDLGAGTGYWAMYLSQYGFDVTAADIQPYQNEHADGNYFNVLEGGIELVRKYRKRILMLVYPPVGDFGMRAVEEYNAVGGQWLVVVASSNVRHWGSSELIKHMQDEWEDVGGVPLRTYRNPEEPFQTMLWVLRKRN